MYAVIKKNMNVLVGETQAHVLRDKIRLWYNVVRVSESVFLFVIL